jgi:hypothetical protein
LALVTERNTKFAQRRGFGAWSVKSVQNPASNTTDITITSAPDSDTPASSLGPFGCFATFFASIQSSSSSSSSSPPTIHPVLSTPLINNAKRTKIVTDKARSSKPGGQASNVGETKITHRLVVDGGLITSATSQDSRSAMHNIDTAMERLMTERLPVANQKLKQLPQLKLLVEGGEKQQQQQIPASLKTSVESIEQDFGKLMSGVVEFSLKNIGSVASGNRSGKDE